MSLEPKVLHIIDSLGLGGAQTGVYGVFEAQPENANIFLYALRKRNVAVRTVHPSIQVFDSSAKYSFAPLLELRKLILKEKINVLHCHLFRSHVFGWLLKVFCFKDIKLVVHEHGEVLQKHRVYNWFLKCSRKQIDRFFAVSEATKEALMKNGKIRFEKIVVLRNFIDLTKEICRQSDEQAFSDKQKMGLDPSKFTIGYVGRLSHEKGCEYLIKALPRLSNGYQAIVVGDGPLRDQLTKLSQELSVSDNVRFMGYMQDKRSYYSLFDLIVIPSLAEACPMVVLEAELARIPMIGSDVVGINELIHDQENGLLFISKNAEDLAHKIEQLRARPELGQELVAAGARFVRSFGLQEYLRKLQALYVELYD